MVGKGRQKPGQETKEERHGRRAGEGDHNAGSTHQVHHHRQVAGRTTTGEIDRPTETDKPKIENKTKETSK